MISTSIPDWLEVILIALGVSVVIAFFYTIPTWLLWNWLMPDIFGLPKITIWAAGGLTLLSTILFKSSASSGRKR